MKLSTLPLDHRELNGNRVSFHMARELNLPAQTHGKVFMYRARVPGQGSNR